MKLYTIQHKEDSEWLLPQRESDYGLFKFDGSSREESWKPVEMKVLRRHEERGPELAPSDLPCSLGNLLVLSRKAKEALSLILASSAELLPLTCQGRQEYWAVNVRRLIDVLDEEKADVVRSDQSKKILIIKKVAFKPEAANESIFKLTDVPRGTVFVNDQFVKIARDTSLQGVYFKPVWELKAH